MLKMTKAKKGSTGAKGHNVRKLLALLFVAIFLASIVPTASAGWDYYREIEIDHSNVSGDADLSSFPVLINHTADWLQRADDGDHVRRTDGYDIVFTNADNSSLLDFEIEKYDGTAGTLVAWVRIPTLGHDANTKIRLWYGNSQATDWSNPTGVWDTNYKGVRHLSETTGGADAIKDSTSNDNDGTDVGSPNLDVAGQIDGADAFDGTDDYVDLGNKDSLDITDAITIEAWLKGDYSSSPGIVSQGTGGKAINYRFGVQIDSTGGLWCNIGDGAEWNGGYFFTSLGANQWHYIAFVVSDAELNAYLNGTKSPTEYDRTIINPSATVKTVIGAMDRGNAKKFHGIIDEVRISDTARSGDWINTSHNNQHSPSTFYSVGASTPTEGSAPVPELPTIILFAVGLVGLAGYVMLRKRNGE